MRPLFAVTNDHRFKPMQMTKKDQNPSHTGQENKRSCRVPFLHVLNYQRTHFDLFTQIYELKFILAVIQASLMLFKIPNEPHNRTVHRSYPIICQAMRKRKMYLIYVMFYNQVPYILNFNRLLRFV